ncbi:MAG: FecR domain-containing protein [Planctomycetes bacterium]|nr:FecR domain-containing protein [Planctomycetota bacterium]
MTTCRELKALLPAYLDDRLPPDDLALVRGHLDGCAPCGRERAALERTDALLGAAFADHPWDDAGVEALVLGLRARARAQVASPAASSRPGRAGGVWVAAAAVLLTAGALVWPQAEQAPPTATARARAGVAGDGLLRAGSDGAYLPVAAGDEVLEGERLLAVAPGARVRLDDGTTVHVHPDTEVALETAPDGGLTVVMGGLDGEVYCDVARRERPLRVAARGLEVQVLGTRFLVHHGREASRVVVLEGRVMASTPGDRRVLGADDAAEARQDEQALRTSRVTAPVWGLWVPEVHDELRRRFAPATTSAPAPGPAERSPLAPTGPTGPIDGDLDTPVVPPVVQPR